jgi:serine protease
VRKLAVLLNYNKGDARSIKAEDLEREFSNPKSVSAEHSRRFSHPLRVSLLLTHRLPEDYRATLPDDDPEELLHRYVVLEYPDTASTMAAKAILKNDLNVRFVQESTFSEFSVAPSDPLYPVVTKVQGTTTVPDYPNYQWGINNPLNLQAAWNTVRGTAYIAHLDNGIQSGRVAGIPVHEDLTQAWRPQFTFNVAGGDDVDEHPDQISQTIPGYPGGYAGHGTHTAGIIAAATTRSGVASGYPNPSPTGGAGVCWYCTLMVAKVSRIVNAGTTIDSTIDMPNAINWAVKSGAQAINLSLGGTDPNCALNVNHAYCLALKHASTREVIVVAAAGNANDRVGGDGNGLGTILDFPAVSPYTIAVGAIQAYLGTRGNLWTEVPPQRYSQGSSTGPGMETRGILAPGRDVLSSMYYGKNWNSVGRCGTSASYGHSRGPNYGTCTGTSMATPHITGIVGLLRTVNPLLSASQITSALLSSGDNAASPNMTRGYGVPNAATAVNNVLATTNRLTPLFSHYSSVAADHFYTVVPQMARAALTAWLPPVPSPQAATQYVPYGTTVAEYPLFAAPQLVSYTSPLAEVWVFTTHANPFSTTVELKPLYRLSWKCGDPGVSVCGTNPKHVSHFYTTSVAEAQSYIGSAYYKFDGIEGYIYPTSLSKPANATPLMRAYNSTRDDYAIFPQQQQTIMANQGYTQNLVTLGYVYLNNGSRPTTY